MIVKDVIKLVSTMLGLDDVTSALNSGYTSSDNIDDTSGEVTFSDDVISEINLLITSYNLTANIIATNYLEIVDSVIKESDGKIYYKDICDGKVFLSVKGIYDLSDNKVDYSLSHDGINVPVGKYKVKIALFPEDKNLEDEISEFPMVISVKILAFGVASEYLLIKGDIDTASVYDLRFKQNLLDATRPRREIKLKARRFV